MSDLYQKMYRRRFGKDVKFRQKMYQVLCADFFQKYIPENATVLEIGAGYCESTDMKLIKNESIDVVFANNFFEHLSKEDIVKTIREVNRVLKRGGKFIILQPNIRFCFKDYWMFF